VDPDTVVDTVRRLLAVRSVGRNDERFVAGAAQMLKCSDDGIAHAIDVREKRFRDNRYSHTITVAASPVDMVTDWRTRHEL
jgi:hypothetical protein